MKAAPISQRRMTVPDGGCTGTMITASERRGSNVKRFKDFYLKAKAVTVLHVPCWLDSGLPAAARRRVPYLLDSGVSLSGGGSPQTVTSKVSTGASKSLYQSRPRTVAFSKRGSAWRPETPIRGVLFSSIGHRQILKNGFATFAVKPISWLKNILFSRRKWPFFRFLSFVGG